MGQNAVKSASRAPKFNLAELEALQTYKVAIADHRAARTAADRPHSSPVASTRLLKEASDAEEAALDALLQLNIALQSEVG